MNIPNPIPEKVSTARVMVWAWRYARAAAKQHGGSASLYIAECIRQSWAEQKANVARRNAMVEGVMAEARRLIEMAQARRAAPAQLDLPLAA